MNNRSPHIWLRQFVLFLFSAISAMFGAVNVQFGQDRQPPQINPAP
jgi:hypothetical protein